MQIKKALEFKDRQQVRELLTLAAGPHAEKDASALLMDYITNPNFLLLGFVEGSSLNGIVGLEIFPKKTAVVLHISVRPDMQLQGIGKKILELSMSHKKLKVLKVKSPDNITAFFQKCGFEISESEGYLEKTY